MRGVDLVQAIDADQVAPGTVGFLFVAALGAALWFLMRSMNRQLKKIDFKPPSDQPDGDDQPHPPAV
ncbi:MAG: hypothetical protein L0Y54_01220 [Sporichthyaceae bacterium]|nr:hypothetical protein [Sporichthyaceae bacterium]